jgi:ATP-dependent exoDNAse (exonuclease V) alpha subunit
MSYKNNNKLQIVNSEEFMVVSFTDEEITMDRDEGGEEVKIGVDEFHKYFLCNYASTAHKSQGATYHGKVILWNWNRMTQDRKVAYTACSRATNINNLIISQGLVSEG